MKFYIIILALFLSHPSLSSIWPSASAPCNTTLDACAEATAEGSFVEVRTNTINENITVFKSVSLVAGNGYRPVFTSGNGIDITAVSASNHNLTIKGFTLVNGRISVNHLGSGDLNLTISDNQFLNNSSSANSFRILQRGSGNLDMNVDFNIIKHHFSSSGNGEGAIKIINNLNVGNVTGRIYGNTIKVSGTDSIGIGIYDELPGTINLNVTGNEIYGASYAGINALTSGTSGNMDLDISSNAIYANADSTNMRGLRVNGNAATLKMDAVNNTILGAFDGMNIFQSGAGVIDASLYNNIIAYGATNSYPVWTGVPGIDNNYNLFYANDNSDSDLVPGPNHMTSDPMIKGLQNARLKVGSPAIDAASLIHFLLVADAPFVDADGTARLKKLGVGVAAPDIGAYESGDITFNHVARTASYISVIDDPNLNGDALLNDLHITSNWNPSAAAGIYNNSNEAIYYAGGFWRVFNEDFVNIPDGATFNIFKNSARGNTFEHTSTSFTSSSIINRSGLDGQSNRILQVSQHWTGTYNDNPFGVFYVSGNWYINNANSVDLPMNSNFNVTYQEPSKSAYKHITNSVNSFLNSTTLDHPLLNGNNCAQIQVTQDASLLSVTTSPVGVWYDEPNWLIFNQNLTNMPTNVIFHVNISPEQSSGCDIIFKDGFGL